MENTHATKPLKLPKLTIKNASTSPRRRALQRNNQISPYSNPYAISVPRRATKRLTPLRSGSIPDKSIIRIQETFTHRILQEPRKIFDRIAEKMIAQKVQKFRFKQASPTASTIDSLNATSLDSHFLEETIKISNQTRPLAQLVRVPTGHNLVSTPLGMLEMPKDEGDNKVDRLVNRYLTQEGLVESVYPVLNLSQDVALVNRYELTSKVMNKELYESDYSSMSLEDSLCPERADSPILTKDESEGMMDYQDMLIKKPKRKRNQCNKPQDLTGKLKKLRHRV